MKRSKKQRQKLSVRISDYHRMLKESKRDFSGYKQPGSNSK